MESVLKKIGILAFVDQEGGGVYQYTHSVIDAVSEDKNNTYIIFTDINNDKFDVYGLEVRKVSKPNIFILGKLIRVLQILFFIRVPLFFTENEKKCFADIDKFVSPAISLYPHFYLNKPFIFTLHDIQERYYPNFFTIKERFIRWLVNRTLSKLADTILCESSFVKKDIMGFLGVQDQKVLVIQSPPPKCFSSIDTHEEKYDSIRDQYGLPSEYIFYPAQFWKHKNHIKLLEAFNLVLRKFPDIKLVFTGSRQNNYSKVRLKIQDLGIQDNVVYLGYIDYQDLPYVYKMSRFLVMATLFESISIPVYEAFSLRVAVCSSNVVALPEQIGNAGLLFDPNDENDMADKMILYLENPTILREKAESGFLKINSFNIDSYKASIVRAIHT